MSEVKTTLTCGCGDDITITQFEADEEQDVAVEVMHLDRYVTVVWYFHTQVEIMDELYEAERVIDMINNRLLGGKEFTPKCHLGKSVS